MPPTAPLLPPGSILSLGKLYSIVQWIEVVNGALGLPPKASKHGAKHKSRADPGKQQTNKRRKTKRKRAKHNNEMDDCDSCGFEDENDANAEPITSNDENEVTDMVEKDQHKKPQELQSRTNTSCLLHPSVGIASRPKPSKTDQPTQYRNLEKKASTMKQQQTGIKFSAING
ncbi:hypothetical protein FQN57_005080 [Myotisia sp. PD_48]|nr:hypothetical protein FQN57_005080 [Myotisia sp. PD_48]